MIHERSTQGAPRGALHEQRRSDVEPIVGRGQCLHFGCSESSEYRAQLRLVGSAPGRGRLRGARAEADWLEAAGGKSLREIEAMVSGHRPGDLPADPTEPQLHRRMITLEVSPETYDIWRRLHALAAEEHGQRLSDDELIQALYRRAYAQNVTGGGAGTSDATAGHADSSVSPAGSPGDSSVSPAGSSVSPPVSPVSPVSPAYQIALKQCPDCKRAWQYTGGRDHEVDPAVFECAACDAVHLGSLDSAALERTTTTVTPRKREQVLARDGHRCTVPGCRRIIGLDLHHIDYQSHGGGHALSNLTAICDLHHRAVHFGKLVILGTAPDRMTFEFSQAARSAQHHR
jgi:hypothetical protein